MLRLNRRVRMLMCVLMFASIGSHLYAQHYPAMVWWALIAQCTVYPHAVFYAGVWSRNPVRTEVIAMVLDLLILGLWLGYLGFPVWVTYSTALGMCIGFSAYFGWPGLAASLVSLIVGAASAVAVWGLRLQPDTSALTTALCMLQAVVFLSLVSVETKRRATELKATKERLHESEAALQQQVQEIQSLQVQLAEQANRDPLTGAFNRRYLDATLPRELARCRREQVPLCLILVDLDHFKVVNDNHGHAAGDIVVKALATLLQAYSRPGDLVCRYGGEEFLVMLPNMDLHTGLARAEEYRMQMANQRLTSAEGVALQVTLSAGVAAYPSHGDDETSLFRSVDTALYQAKDGGRNRVAAIEDKGALAGR